MFTVNARQLAAVATWAHFDAKHRLSAVVFAPGEYMACDPHRFVRVPCGYRGKPFGISRSDALAVTAAIMSQPNSSQMRDVDIECRKGRVNACFGSLGVSVPCQDISAYPSIAKLNSLAPASGKGTPPEFTFNATFAAAIADVLDGQRIVTLSAWGGKLDPFVLTSSNGIRFVVMPIKAL